MTRLTWIAILFSSCSLGGQALAQSLPLVQTIEMPEVPAGPYADHMAIDLRGNRLFTTPQANHAVDVLDLKTGKVLQTITGFGNPHAILFSEATNRIFVTDGGDGALKVFDASSYKQVKTISLEADADGIAFDQSSGLLYVSNGGEAAGKPDTLISIIDIAKAEKVGDISIEAEGLEAMTIDSANNRLYVNVPSKNQIAIVDLGKRKVIDTWTLTKGKMNMAFAFNLAQHRLYVGCRDTDVRGSIVVIDTENGRELERLPIGGWVDSMFYDASTGHIYASSGVGEVFTYQRQPDGSYKKLGETDTAVMAKTSLYVPDLHRLYVAVPHLGGTVSKILVFQTDQKH